MVLNDDETVTFKQEEKMTYGALGYDGNDLMAAISGYDLNISFNMKLINSLADAEACANALADVFYQLLMEQLIANKVDVFNSNEKEVPILSKESPKTEE